jgi:ketol-acid reductoisomerase
LDWAPKFRDAVIPLFDELYKSVIEGKETQRTLDRNSAPDYRERLQEELDVIGNSEMWQAGKAVRSLRPENRGD